MSAMPGSGASATEDGNKPMEQRTNLKLKRRCGTGDKSYSSALAKSRFNFQKKKANAKDYILVDENEGFGDSEDCYQTPGPCDFSEGTAVSRSPLNTCISKEHKRGSSYISNPIIIDQLSKAYDILKLKMVEDQKARARKLYRAVKSMEQVELGGPAFLVRAIVYLMESKLDKLFLAFQNDAQRWECLKHLSD